MSTEQTTILAWHFCERAVLAHGDGRALRAGETYSVEPPITCCERGLHASERVLDAWGNVEGRLLCRVELSGAMDREPEKIAAQHRRVLDIRIVARSDIDRLRSARAPARQAYQAAIATAWQAYEAAIATARQAYEAARAPARQAYEAAIATAEQAYEAARAPARQAYQAAIAPAWQAYEAARAPAEQAYEAARATAEIEWYAALPRWEAGDPL